MYRYKLITRGDNQRKIGVINSGFFLNKQRTRFTTRTTINMQHEAHEQRVNLSKRITRELAVCSLSLKQRCTARY